MLSAEQLLADLTACMTATSKWARLVSNQRPLACEASALPLSYAPSSLFCLQLVFECRHPTPLVLGSYPTSQNRPWVERSYRQLDPERRFLAYSPDAAQVGTRLRPTTV